MNSDKKKIVDGAKQYASYVARNVPQMDDMGRVKYYFSGSLAMLLLSSAKFIKSFCVDREGVFMGNGPDVYVDEDSRQNFEDGIRPISMDVDIVATDGMYFAHKGKIYNLAKVKETCDLATTLCPSWERQLGTTYFDVLSEERGFNAHDVAEVALDDGTELLIADPLSLLMHKFADGITCLRQIEKMSVVGKLTLQHKESLEQKYQKDVKDFSSMFNGVASLYPEADFNKAMDRVLANCSGSAFSPKLLSDSDNVRQFFNDVREYIDVDFQDEFEDFINAARMHSVAVM